MTDISKQTGQKQSAVNRERDTQKVKARQIASEIVRFGVTQYQILYIIRLLSLELENVELMRSLTDLIKTSEESIEEDCGQSTEFSKKIKIYT